MIDTTFDSVRASGFGEIRFAVVFGTETRKFLGHFRSLGFDQLSCPHMASVNEGRYALLQIASSVDVSIMIRLVSLPQLLVTYDRSTHCALLEHASMHASKDAVLMEVRSPPAYSLPQMTLNRPFEV